MFSWAQRTETGPRHHPSAVLQMDGPIACWPAHPFETSRGVAHICPSSMDGPITTRLMTLWDLLLMNDARWVKEYHGIV